MNFNILRTLTVAAALSAVAPSAQAEQITAGQRVCVQSVLKNPAADTKDVQACVSAKVPASDKPDQAKKELAPDSPEAKALFAILEARFSKPSSSRPSSVAFADVKKALEARPDLLRSLNEMEQTGGEPDVIAVEGSTYVFADVSRESPEGRRNLTYGQAKAMAEAAGYEMMDEATYRKLQAQYSIDTKTWSWLLTADPELLKDGSALRGYRYGGGVGVNPLWADDRGPYGGFRCLLRVPRPLKL